MRNRKEIEDSLVAQVKVVRRDEEGKPVAVSVLKPPENTKEEIIMEVLLDIRDLLQEKKTK